MPVTEAEGRPPNGGPARETIPSSATLASLVRRVDIFTLKLFLSAVEEGQIGRAAAREHIVASAATRRIQELEELAGMRLFERFARGVVPSAAGMVVARHARSMLAALDAMHEELEGLIQRRASHLSIAATRLLIVYFLADEIGRFSRRHPHIDVELREELYAGTARAVLEGEVELAVYDIRNTSCEIEGLESRECRNDGLVAVIPVGHPLARAHAISLENLLDQELIGTRHGSCLVANLREAAQRVGREVRFKCSVDTVEAARSLVSAGLGLSIQPASSTPPAGEHERAVIVPIEGDWATLSYRVGWQAGRPLSAASIALVEQLTRSTPA
jgi:DNA-binding transcriptional LysR family regulator